MIWILKVVYMLLILAPTVTLVGRPGLFYLSMNSMALSFDSKEKRWTSTFNDPGAVEATDYCYLYCKNLGKIIMAK